jgi:serine/threonine protein kinase
VRDNHTRLEAIFEAALPLATQERQVYIAKACGEDETLRQRVEGLLRNLSVAGGFLAEEAKPTAAQGAMAIEKPGDLIGRYKLVEKTGEGGMGVVYIAEQEEPVRRRVALKIIKLGMDTKLVVARFEAERQALALMDHPNIARVLDAGATETGRPYFVMELVQGISITEFCDRQRLPPKERLRLFILVCQAIQSAHQKGIIHRDIKPSNILVSLHSGIPVPKVIDFGVAKAISQRLTDKPLFTRYSTLIGTPTYMSPEQADLSDGDVDTRTDVYSLGVLLYELLTGTTPFSDECLRKAGYSEIQRLILEAEPERPSTRLNAMPAERRELVARDRQVNQLTLERLFAGDLDSIVMKCLEKDRSRRYETVNGLAMDIQRHLANEPIVARPPSPWYRLRKFARRNRVLFGAGVAVTLALVAGLGLASLGFAQARQKLSWAQRARLEAMENARRAEEQGLIARKSAYAADMNLALQAARKYNVPRVRELLRKYLPRAGELDLRGFEWRYIVGLYQGDSIRTLNGHTGAPVQLSFSTDGRNLFSCGADGFIKTWDVANGQELASWGAQSSATSAAFSHDGRYVALESRNGRLKTVVT